MAVYLLFGALLLLGLLSLTIPYMGGKTLTGPATIVSLRVAKGQVGARYSCSWLYLVTARLSDGEEIQLYALESTWRSLKEGQTGLLSWQKDTFIDFIPDKEV